MVNRKLQDPLSPLRLVILANEKPEEPFNPLRFVSRDDIRVDLDSVSLRRERHDSCNLILANENLEEPLMHCILFSTCACEVAVNTFQSIWIQWLKDGKCMTTLV